MIFAHQPVHRIFRIFLHPGAEAEEDQENFAFESFVPQASWKEAPIKEHLGESVSGTPFQTLARTGEIRKQTHPQE
jgi:hypothetical protein